MFTSIVLQPPAGTNEAAAAGCKKILLNCLCFYSHLHSSSPIYQQRGYKMWEIVHVDILLHLFSPLQQLSNLPATRLQDVGSHSC